MIFIFLCIKLNFFLFIDITYINLRTLEYFRLLYKLVKKKNSIDVLLYMLLEIIITH